MGTCWPSDKLMAIQLLFILTTKLFSNMKKIALFMALILIGLQACKKTETNEMENPDLRPELTAEALQIPDDPTHCHNALTDTELPWHNGFIGSLDVRYQVTPAGTILLEGDIAVPAELITDAPTTEERGASKAGVYLWPQARVYYSFAAGYPTNLRNAFLTACQKWNLYTGIQFIQRTTQANYIRVFKDGNSNYSYVGYQGGMQNLSLADANPGVAIHELGHALGLIHEHQRSDRNTKIWVNPAVANTGNYLRYTNSYNYTTFDWNSIMLYGSSPYGSSWTMLQLPGNTPFTNTIEYWRSQGSYALPSSGDIYAVNYMY